MIEPTTDPLIELIEKMAVLRAEKKKLIQLNLELGYKNDELKSTIVNMERMIQQSEDRMLIERRRNDKLLHENKVLISHISNDMAGEYFPHQLTGDLESGYSEADPEGAIEDWRT